LQHYGRPLSPSRPGTGVRVRKRVLLSQVPHLLGDLFEALFAGCPDIAVVGEVGVGESLSARVEETHADVLIVAQDAIGDSAATFQLLNRYPHLRVLVLVAEARRAYLYELRPAAQDLNGISLRDLVRLIRHPSTLPSP
jgi:DNA-binding NarL/FixJ family response regulator